MPSVMCKCEVCSVGCEERSVKSEDKVRLALHCNVIAQVMFLENNHATASHKVCRGVASTRRMKVL